MNVISRTVKFILRHKIRAALVVLIVIGAGWYVVVRQASPAAQVRYVTASVQKGMMITSIAGTGQVTSESQIDVKPKVSGAVISLQVKEGQAVKKGDVLVTLDNTSALRTVRDANQSVHDASVSVQQSQLSLQKLRQPATASALLAAQNAVNQAERHLQTLKDAPTASDLAQAQSQVDSAYLNTRISSDGKTPQVVRNAYDAMVGTLRTTEQVLTDSLTDADSVLGVDNALSNLNFANLLSSLDSRQKDLAVAAYGIAKPAVARAKTATEALPLVNADPDKVDQAVATSQDALDKTATLLLAVYNALQATPTSNTFSQSSLDGLKSTIQSDRTNVNSKSSSFVTQQQSIIQARTTYQNAQISYVQAQSNLDEVKGGTDPKDLASAEESLKEKKQQLAELKSGATGLDLAVAQNSLDQKRLSYVAAQAKLADATAALKDYQVTSPFDGVVAKLSVQVSDQAGSGSAVATITTQQKSATVSLNEVDAAKIKAGQKATLTFDAIDGLSISGDVNDVSTLGTVSQGVVSYSVRILFDTQDPRVLAGMSVRASIITNMIADAILVPNAAVKTVGGQSYIDVVDQPPATTTTAGNVGIVLEAAPRRQAVTVGLSNDSQTQIIEGVAEGETVVVRTIQPSTSKTTTTSASTGSMGGIRIPGVTTGAAGGARMPTGGRPD